MKNIPIPGNKVFMKAILQKTNFFIRRMRWRAFHFDNRTRAPQDRPDHLRLERVFHTYRNPPPMYLEAFEEDLMNMVTGIKLQKNPTRNTHYHKN